MVITKSILESSRPNQNLLESIQYLAEDESGYPAAKVPVRENERFGYTIALEDINNFCESNATDDMGYAVRQICNASGIDPYNVVFSIKEENLIDKETTDFVLDIMQEGVPVVVAPISKNCIEYIMVDEAVDYFMHTGDESLLEALANDDIEAFAESRDQRNGNKRRAQHMSGGFKNHKHEWEDEEEMSVKQRRKQEKKKGAKNNNTQTSTSNTTPPPSTQQSPPPPTPPPDPEPKQSSNQQNKQQQQTNSNTTSNTNNQSRSSTSQQATEKEAEQEIPKPKDSKENKFFNAAKNAIKKGKNHIERLIIALRKKLDEWDKLGQAANAGYLTRLRGYVSRILGYLIKRVVEFTAS